MSYIESEPTLLSLVEARRTGTLRAIRWLLACALLVGVCTVMHQHAYAQELKLPDITLGEKTSDNPKEVALPLELLMLMTTLSLAPYILIMTTSFIRITIVLSFLKTAMGTQQVPPTQVLMGLALFMTFYVMQPVILRIDHDALQPYYNKKIKQSEFFDRIQGPIKEFMFINCRPRDIMLFMKFDNLDPATHKISGPKDVPIYIMLPAFMTSEIKTAFSIGFLLYIPFLVVDMVVASVLMSMGMFMLSPMSISLPFKLLLFVMINGWELIITGLVHSFKQIPRLLERGSAVEHLLFFMQRTSYDDSFIMSVCGEALYLILILSAPMLMAALGVGLIVSILQATTQVQEQTLGFVPKLVVTFLSLLLCGTWIGAMIGGFFTKLLLVIPYLEVK